MRILRGRSREIHEIVQPPTLSATLNRRPTGAPSRPRPAHSPQPSSRHARHQTPTRSCASTPRKTSRTTKSGTRRSTSRVTAPAAELVWSVESTVRITKTKSGSTVTTKVNALHADGLGSVRAVTDGAGAVVERTTYRPYRPRRCGLRSR